MTKIAYAHGGSEYSISVMGHSGYAPIGQDIVCAAISSHLYTLMNALPQKLTAADIDMQIPSAYIRMSSKAKEDKAVFSAVAEGMRLIALEYPEYCTFIEL